MKVGGAAASWTAVLMISDIVGWLRFGLPFESFLASLVAGQAAAAGAAGPLAAAVHPGGLLLGDVAAVDAGQGLHQLVVGLLGLLLPGPLALVV
jgi:hypothetical protein